MNDLAGLDFAPSIFARVMLHDRTITPFDWMLPQVSDGRNLISTDRQGALLWQAKCPSLGAGEDCFTNVRLEGDEIIVSTWSCYNARLNRENGEISDPVFTK